MTKQCKECGANTGPYDTEAHYITCSKRLGKKQPLQELIEERLMAIKSSIPMGSDNLLYIKVVLDEIAQLAEEGERQRILKEIKHWQKTIQKETGAFKYDFVFQGIYQLLSNQKEDENNPEN